MALVDVVPAQGAPPSPPPIEGVDATMPAWFQAWDANQFQPMAGLVAQIPGLRTAVDGLVNDFAVFRAQTSNGQRATGNHVPFSVVLFTNGDDPTLAPHHLPALHSLADLTYLTAAELTAYIVGYGLPAGGNRAARLRRVQVHIGYIT
ncbi:hypothetical protein C8F01DRAFT_1152849 [Mycena amicta]|nr:hypothetical protein C8F01DRAFT_1152849 [Mycena amicta]